MSTEKTLTIRLHRADNVVVTLVDLPAGTEIPAEGVTCRSKIPVGHKVATASIKPDDPVRKYSQIIGFATSSIVPGDHVHTHNMGMKDFSRDYAIGEEVHPTKYIPEEKRATFQGIVRPDGRVATRNFIGVLPSSNCSATVARYIAEPFRGDALADFPNVDGVVALCHEGGCGMPVRGEWYETLHRTLGGFVRHPNMAGVVVVGLGCEVNQVDVFMENMGLKTGAMLKPMVMQEMGGTIKTVQEGIAHIKDMLPEANKVKRQTVPADRIILAMECGGSDAYSGITANPALGAAADILVSHGGTAVLAETPEIYGAEHLLTRRAVSREVGEKLLALLRWWEQYTARSGQEMDNNPSPGNRAGGLTTILEKSLGASAKGGTTNLVEVYRHAESITVSGFVFMDSPGFDAISITGMIAGGANVVCFTTGRGSAFGSKPVPCIKLATNTTLFRHMEGDMDINCGAIVDGEATVDEMGRRIFQTILDVASGKRTKSEILGYGDNEFVPWLMGAIM
jgi:altronate hydrolase